MKINKQEKRNTLNIPNPPPFKKMLGPSFVLLGLGLGSGEVILWPYLSSKYGMGIIWGAIIGITLQFFINMEAERYTLITGESVFVGLFRKIGKIAPIWFILSTFIPWMWPGIIASSAQIFSHLFNISYTPLIPSFFLIIIGIIFTFGGVIYKTQEKLLKILVSISIPFILTITILFLNKEGLKDLSLGIIGVGKDYYFLPAGISLATLLSAFAYAGAGGNLNLAQSYYIKEKGYGMGKYSGRITSILNGKKEKISIFGNIFPLTQENLKKFRIWWQKINWEHLLIFWATGAFTMILLSFLAYLTVYNTNQEVSGVEFIIKESEIIGEKTISAVGSFFLGICSLMLFFTQFSILDATSRIGSENLLLIFSSPSKSETKKIPTLYYLFLWLEIIVGIIIFSLGLIEPFTLLILGAILNAITMFIYCGLLIWLNNSALPKTLRPSYFRTFWLFLALIFYGIFSYLTISQFY